MLILKKISTRIYLSEFSCRCRCCYCVYCCSERLCCAVLLLSCPSNGKQNARRKQKRIKRTHKQIAKRKGNEYSWTAFQNSCFVLCCCCCCYSIGKMKTKRKHRCMWKWNANLELNSMCERFDAAMRLGRCFNWPKWINVCKFNSILIKGH